VPSGEWFQVSVSWLKKGWEALPWTKELSLPINWIRFKPSLEM